MTKRIEHTKEFKREAVRLMESIDKPVAQLARELGINRNQLYKWQKEIQTKGADAFGKPGPKATAANELARLKRENKRLQEENEILKKADAYFAREPK